MATKTQYKMETQIRVPVFGGPWDGSEFLATDLTPGKIYRLEGVRYVMDWRLKRPRLTPFREGIKYGK